MFRGYVKSIVNGLAESYSIEEIAYDEVLSSEFNLKKI